MFGVVPKTYGLELTHQMQITGTWATGLLIEQDNQLLLIDTGIGNAIKNFSLLLFAWRRHPRKILNTAGYSIDDITDVLLTHLHFELWRGN